MTKILEEQDWLDVVIVGAGAAGIGCAILLQQLGVERLRIVERAEIGSSFLNWPKEMRFITPSFPSNEFGLLDLNAVAPHTSPGYTLKKEHPTGPDYATYLRGVAAYFELAVQPGTDVLHVQPASSEGGFIITTTQGPLYTRYLIWAGGEFQYPRLHGFAGSELCRHTSQVGSWQDLAGDTFLIIGGYESGIDAAVHLVAQGKQVDVIDSSSIWQSEESDPSRALSPYTQERLQQALATNRLRLIGEQRITSVQQTEAGYIVESAQGERYISPTAPILATGFVGSQQIIADLFETNEAGHMVLTTNDESTLIPGLFLVGPQLRQEHLIFCFIYKFRQRFAVVAHQIAQYLHLDTSLLDEYREQGMFLDDLSCCEERCEC